LRAISLTHLTADHAISVRINLIKGSARTLRRARAARPHVHGHRVWRSVIVEWLARPHWFVNMLHLQQAANIFFKGQRFFSRITPIVVTCIFFVAANEVGFLTIFFLMNASFIALTVDAIGLVSVEFHMPA